MISSNVADLKSYPLPEPGHYNALKLLRLWLSASTDLSFVYLRSLGGLVQTGRGRILSLSDTSIMIDANGSTLFIVLLGALFDDTPQIFFTAHLSGNFQVPGVSISLDNHDWLFLSADQIPKEALLLHESAPRI